MKKIFLTAALLLSAISFSQNQFSGLSTSSRVGIVNAEENPAELVNLSKKFEVNVFGLSFNLANNKIGFSDFTSSNTNFEDLIFAGSDPANLNIDAEIIGPSVAMKWKKWGFGFTTKAYAKFSLVDIDTSIGDAITTGGINSLFGTSTISNDYNERLSGTAWGEIGLSAARVLYDNEKYQLSVGAKLKLLFPGTYANFGADKFNGTITTSLGQANLSDVVDANLNIAYSGNLADSFTNYNDYSKSIFGGLNGIGTDIGVDFRIKDGDKYKLNAGLSIKNIGSMTFKDDNNYSTNYKLNIPQATVTQPGLDLNQFQDVNSLQDIENILLASGYLDKTTADKKEFKVKLPTQISLYADVKIVPKFYVSGFLQQKVGNVSDNDQITAVNAFTITPRLNLGFFEVYLPYNNNEISGSNLGLGFRVAGFYLGSGSAVTALINDSKQFDLYVGYRIAFL